MRWPDRPRSQGHRDSAFCHDLITTGPIVAIWLPGLTIPSQPSSDPVAIYLPERSRTSCSVQDPIVISVDPVATLTGVRCETEDDTYTQEDGNDQE
ncbi:hypothetical protein Taro_000981 [Colocasia esculenta]|uniref:Uncharacterized protein n=1 Tax=Colocasia esculenta TaxID=4460 RepID=A0A843TDJ2_COLES|nr:hypothetical protein [Colocasia esculenta]